jgi:prevent-host-death family protein
MTTLTATEARANFYRMIDDVAISHKPILITSKRNNAILLSEQDWSAIQESLFLLSIPGMRESIKEGMAEDISECRKELDW